jgi:hypothetical protein
MAMNTANTTLYNENKTLSRNIEVINSRIYEVRNAQTKTWQGNKRRLDDLDASIKRTEKIIENQMENKYGVKEVAKDEVDNLMRCID